MKQQAKPIIAPSRSSVHLRAAGEGFELGKCAIWVERDNFHRDDVPSVGEVQLQRQPADEDQSSQKRKKPRAKPRVKRDPNEPFMVIGFDTEFKAPHRPMERQEVKEGRGKYEVLSYQVACKVIDPAKGNGPEWTGICYPEDRSIGSRLSLSEVVTFAIWQGIKTGTVTAVPTKIYLVGHFTRADIPAFRDFQTLTKLMSSVRSTFLSIDNHIDLHFDFADDAPPVEARLLIRDTMLLTPAASKSLRALGELVGVEKVTLSDDPEKELWLKRNMDGLLESDPDLFEKYAITDALICLRYVEQLLDQSRLLLGHSKIPATLTSIGVDLLWKLWENDGLDPLAILGKEEVVQSFYSKRLGYYVTERRHVPGELPHLHMQIATESYHGGRNEQFWFGPGFEDDWTDYDLTSAYPSAMALIAMPDWANARVSLDVNDYTPTTLGSCRVEFEFPERVRFPTLPVRTANGLIFPLKGVSYCCAPEVALARSLGATIKIAHGVVIPPLTKDSTPQQGQSPNPNLVFQKYIKHCVEQRSKHKKKSLSNLFWKELSNSTYGKTAQGLHEKRVYDMRDRETKPLPESKITNPYFAGFITSFVRAVLGEIINRLPTSVCVFSCTTDGFLSNATEAQIEAASQGTLVALYRESRAALTGDANHLEVKHGIRQPLGWRTRGQCTLQPGGSNDADANIVLAKGGIYLAEELDEASKQNDYIVKLFLNRHPDDVVDLVLKTGIRDIVERDNDLVEKSAEKRLNMEFDWKRRPFAAANCMSPKHLAFSTVPWNTVEEFMMVKDYWQELWRSDAYCLKTLDDFQKFATTVHSRSSLGRKDSRYLKKNQPDITRLRQSLGAAWRHSQAGLRWQMNGLSNSDFAKILTDCGVPCSKDAIGNDVRRAFVAHQCVGTPIVQDALAKLRERLPGLRPDDLLKHSDITIELTSCVTQECEFIARLNTSLSQDPAVDLSPKVTDPQPQTNVYF